MSMSAIPLKVSKLNQEQNKVYTKVIGEEKNIFFTGCAGTGKSFLLECIVETLRGIGMSTRKLAITASTGRAAFNISGTTLHSFAGIGLGNGRKEELLKRISYNKKVNERWNTTSLLIIDEISMIDGDLFDKLEYIARKIRKDKRPFGGMQLLLTGDLLQLPPVSTGSQVKKRIFEAECWERCIDEYICLKTIHRQSDLAFARVLTCIRLGHISDEVKTFMEKAAEEKIYEGESGPVNLYATRDTTDGYNQSKLDSLSGESRIYDAQDRMGPNGNSTSLNQCPAVKTLEVKIGAQVMLIKNLTSDLVNGTVGIVTSFTKKLEGRDSSSNTPYHIESYPVVRFTLADQKVYTRPLKRESWNTELSDGTLVASRSQVPLILAWAVTIHKSQGQTIQRLKADITSVFESGQVYTALSRAVSPDSLQVVGFDPDRIQVDQKSVEFCVSKGLI